MAGIRIGVRDLSTDWHQRDTIIKALRAQLKLLKARAQTHNARAASTKTTGKAREALLEIECDIERTQEALKLVEGGDA